MSDVLADLRATMAKLAELPPAPFLGSSRLLSATNAISFKNEGRDYAGAHPRFWRSMPEATAPFPSSIFRIEIFDLDVDVERRREFFDAMADAMGAERPSTVFNGTEKPSVPIDPENGGKSPFRREAGAAIPRLIPPAEAQ